MNSLINIILDRHFDYRTFSIENLRFGDSYTKIDLDKVAEIYMDGQTGAMTLSEKYNKLSCSNGYIHLEGVTLEISNASIKSICLRDKYIRHSNLQKKQDIELELGAPDKVMTDGIMWGTGYSIEARVFVYRTLKLYLHIDPDTDQLKELNYGEVNEMFYD